MNIAKQILTTRGVNSKVFQEGIRQTKMIRGHIGLFDFDGISKQKVLDECLELEGINILWESSDTGYHLWNLCIRTKEEIALLGLKLGSDCKHVQHGYRQGKWVLRIVPKYRKDCPQYSVYKPAPKLLHTWCNESLRIQSKAHFRLYIALTGKTILYFNEYQFEGISAEIEDYMTMTDTMKDAISI